MASAFTFAFAVAFAVSVSFAIAVAFAFAIAIFFAIAFDFASAVAFASLSTDRPIASGFLIEQMPGKLALHLPHRFRGLPPTISKFGCAL